MNLGGKWIEGIRPEGSVAEAATLSLSARLAAVGHWLPLAAGHADQDAEYVHQLRVSTRRAVAALALYRDWQAPRKHRWLKKRLKKIRRAAGAARDLDVLGERFGRELSDADADELLSQIAAQRAAAQPAIVDIAERLRRDERFARKVHALLDGIGPRGKQSNDAEQLTDFRHWAQERLVAVAKELFDAMPRDLSDTLALHQFRIRGKALRYAIELLAPAFEPELRREHYKVVEELQERLGKINDHVVGERRLRQWSDEVTTDQQETSLERLADEERERIGNAIESFGGWWTTERIDALRAGFASQPRSGEGQ